MEESPITMKVKGHSSGLDLQQVDEVRRTHRADRQAGDHNDLFPALNQITIPAGCTHVVDHLFDAIRLWD